MAIFVRPLICTYWTKSLYSLGKNLVSASGGSYRWLSASKIGNGTSSRCDNWPMKSSFAIYENTILYRCRIAMRPHHPTWSARHVDLVRGGGRFTGLGDQVAVGRTADGEFVTVHAHPGVPVAAAGIHPGEATQVLDVYRLDCRRLRALVD